jgi:hypothetical protein
LRSCSSFDDDDAAAVALLLLCAPRAVELGRLAVADIAPSSGHLVMLLTRKGGCTDAVPVPAQARPLLETLTAGRVRPLTHRVYEASAAV